ncbi:MAG: adenine deaminase [Candidatus Heimdallarchaeota archaeon]|nr:adenine deaminase [Candidatus Heimdallarchaeota archaeon]
MSKFIRTPQDLERQISAAMGDLAADLLLINATVVNTLTGEQIKQDIAIKDNRIIRVGDITDLLGKYQSVKKIDCSNNFLIPGLIDSHLHTESTLMSPTHFTQVALPRGTTTVAVDPHEIGNVLGIPGLELYVEEAITLPLEFLVEIPSCVPAAPSLENGPNTILADEYIPLLADHRFFALAEMMNFPGVIYRDEEVIKKLAYAEKAGKVREGHAPGLMGKKLQAYITAGVSSCHESFTVKEVIEKLRAGCKIQLREGSYARNLVELASGIRDQMKEAKNPWDQVIICSDDRHADDLLDTGHIDNSLRLLVNEVGIDPITAIRICTLNPAQHLLRPDLGALAPGRIANIVRVNNLNDFRVMDVISQGRHVAHNHLMLENLVQPQYPNWALDTVKPRYVPKSEDFFISGPAQNENGRVKAHIIGVIDHSLMTDHFIEDVRIEDNKVVLEDNRDLAYYFLLDRHANTSNFAKSLVKGFKFQGDVAVASTVAHDSHQLLITGNDQQCMERAMKEVISSKGGQTIVTRKNEDFEIKILPLPYAGLMSLESPRKIAKIMTEMKSFSKEICTGISEPFMALSFMALPVIPKLKLSDKGVVDVDQFKIIDLFE